MSNELQIIPKIDDEKFGKLIELPSMYERNLLRATNAKAYTTLQLAAISLVDYATVSVEFMEKLLEPVVELRSMLAEAKKEVKAERDPYTQKMSEIVSMFTGIEKDFDSQIDIVAAIQNKWELEKIRRTKLKAEQDALDLAKATARITIKSNLNTEITRAFKDLLSADIKAMSDAYYKKTAAELPGYAAAIQEWTPGLDEADFETLRDAKTISHASFTSEEIAVIRNEVATSLRIPLHEDYHSAMTTERDRLIELVPSRIIEINEGDTAAATARIAAESLETERLLNEALSNKRESAALETETEKLNVGFEISAKAGPVMTRAKGAVQKKKYVPASHKAFVAILQQWVSKEMNTLTVPELEKKLSFMVTAANARLNQGETLIAEGLTVIDDISTRTTKAK